MRILPVCCRRDKILDQFLHAPLMIVHKPQRKPIKQWLIYRSYTLCSKIFERLCDARAKDLFPSDSAITVTFNAGTPSAEGPRKTKKAHQESFRTFAPLKITEHRCGWSDTCQPFQPFNIWFNNPLDMEKFEAGPANRQSIAGVSQMIRR